jgi:microcystin-dependent protein
MAICRDCLQNCDLIVGDRCVQYTGPDIPELGICQGDTLSELEAAIVERLLSVTDGTGITLDDLVTDGCTFMSDQLGVQVKTLQNILQILWNTGCTLRELIEEIDEQIANNPVFNTACLTGLPTNPTRDDILQAAVTLLCSLKTTVDAFPTTYVRLSDLTNLVTLIFNDLSGTSQVNSRMVPYTAIAYFGPLTNFDSGGAGISALGYNKIYICNGSNGTPDLRGRTVVGAIRNSPGGALDAAVDPAVSPNNPNWQVSQKLGETYHTLTTPEIPAHTHTVTDPGHKHNILGQSGGDNNDNNNTTRFAGGDKGQNESGFFFTNTQACQTATTGITIASAGGGQPHNNIQPSMGAYYIMYIP